jgi:hypothetical protein
MRSKWRERRDLVWGRRSAMYFETLWWSIIQGRAEENVQKSSVTLRITGTSRANVHTFWLYIEVAVFYMGIMLALSTQFSFRAKGRG